MKNFFKLAVITMGFSGFIAQMVLLRELLVIFAGNELSIGVIIANWLILEAFGCFWLGKKAEKTEHGIEAFTGITVLFSIYLPAAIYIARNLKNILGIAIGEAVGLPPVFYSSFLILLPASILHGALFTFSCKIFSSLPGVKSLSAGKIYVYEIMGTVTGGITWTYLLIPYLHTFSIAVGLASLNFLVCAFLFIPKEQRLRLKRKALLLFLCFLFASFSYSIFAGAPERLQNISVQRQWKGHNVLHYQNSIYGNITVIESGGQYTFFTDGIPYFTTPVPDIYMVEEFVHLPMLYHPYPKNILVVSGGAGGVINEILKYPAVELVEYAELDPLLIELVRKYPTSLTERELTDKRVTVRNIDGRLLLKTTDNRYDLIMVGIPEPADLMSNRFFTREFFALAKDKMEEEGLLVISLPGSLSHDNEALRNLNSCIYRTISGVFPHARAFPGEGTNLFIASLSEQINLIDISDIEERIEASGVSAEISVPWHIEYKMHPRWVDWFEQFIESKTEKINRDFMPLGVFYSISYWNSIFNPSMEKIFSYFEKLTILKFFIIFVLFTLVSLTIRAKNRWSSPSWAVPFSISSTGFSGMIFTLALMFVFQSLYGYVFAWIGLFVTSFMAGSASGALYFNLVAHKIKDCRRFFVKVEGAIILFSILMPLIFYLLGPYLESPHLLFFLKGLFLAVSFINGFLTGAQFPAANRLYLERKSNLSRTAGLIYASDLMGGWLGGIAGGVVLLPVMGLYGTCAVVLFLKLSSFSIITGR